MRTTPLLAKRSRPHTEDVNTLEPALLPDNDVRLKNLGATPTAAFSKFMLSAAGNDTFAVNSWLFRVFKEKEANKIIATSNNSLHRMSQTFETLKRHGRLNADFFTALSEYFEARATEINTVKNATLQESRGWRDQLTVLLLSLFTDPLAGDNQALDDFFAHRFDWFRKVLYSITAASDLPATQYASKVANTLKRFGWLDNKDFYQAAHANVRDDLQPVLLHIWKMEQDQKSKHGLF